MRITKYTKGTKHTNKKGGRKECICPRGTLTQSRKGAKGKQGGSKKDQVICIGKKSFGPDAVWRGYFATLEVRL